MKVVITKTPNNEFHLKSEKAAMYAMSGLSRAYAIGKYIVDNKLFDTPITIVDRSTEDGRKS